MKLSVNLKTINKFISNVMEDIRFEIDEKWKILTLFTLFNIIIRWLNMQRHVHDNNTHTDVQKVNENG